MTRSNVFKYLGPARLLRIATIGWSQRGNPMLHYDGHTYSLIKKKKKKGKQSGDPNRRIWRCSTHHSRGCTARVHTWGTDIFYSTKHNHNDDNLLELYQMFPVANFIPTRKGSLLLVHDGYAFRLKNKLAHGRKQWYCTARVKTGCLVDATTSASTVGSGTVVQRVREVHNHQPPGFYRRKDGSYKIV